MANFFSFLDGKEGEIDFEEVKLLAREEKRKVREARVAAAEEEMKELQQNQNQSSPHSRQSENGRDGKQQRYNGRGPRRNGEAVGNGSSQSNGYQQKQGPDNGYPHSGGNRRDTGVVDGVPSNDGYGFRGNNRRNEGYQPNYNRNNGYQGNYRGNDGYGYQGNYRSRGYQGEGNGYSYKENNIEHVAYEGEQRQIDRPRSEHGWVPYKRNYGRDFANGNGRRGRGSNQGYYRNKSQGVDANEQPINEGQDEWQPRGDEHVDEKDAGDQVSKTLEDKEVKADEIAVKADGSVVANEAYEEAKPMQKKLNGDIINKRWSEMTEDERKAVRAKRAEERDKEIEEDKKLMTFEQFEKIRLEKKKALLEATKTKERKVAMDKDFDLMQPIHKKKEEEKAVEQSEKEQLKRKNIHVKDEKAVESNILKEFFNSSGGARKTERRGGQYEARRFDGPNSRNCGRQQKKATEVVKLEDESQFPVLGGSSA